MTLDATLQERAHQMRRNPTEPEKRLWRSLSNSQLADMKFRRQQVIHPYIVDFLCPAKALVIEVDGDTHEAGADARRDVYLANRGFRVLRFTNADVIGNLAGVLQTIALAVSSSPDRWPRPNPVSGRSGPRPDLNRAGRGSPDTPEGEGLAPHTS